MSTTADRALLRIRRGERVALIRHALGLNGADFAALMRRQLQAAGIDTRYDKAKISRIESGGRQLSAEECAIITLLDPEHRSAMWLIFGTAAQSALRYTQPASTAAKSKKKKKNDAAG